MLVILKTGQAIAPVLERRGDYDRLLAEGIGVSRYRSVDVVSGDNPPTLERITAVVVTGSSALVTEREPWSERTGRWLVDAAQHGLPILAVCYGHQLLADALGGRVDHNPKGRQIGSIDVHLSEEGVRDPLLGARGPTLRVHATHRQAVLELPPGAVRLASNALDENQAYRLFERVWAVQFHPEFDAEIMREYVLNRVEILRAEGLDPDALLERIHETHDGGEILRRFGQYCGIS